MDILEPESIQALGATLYQNERPLHGTAGLVDWHFPRVISDFIRSGAISGRSGELVCVPVTYRDRPIRVFLLGNGENTQPGDRPKVTESGLRALGDQVLKLRIETLALDARDFGVKAKKDAEALLKGIHVVWVGE